MNDETKTYETTPEHFALFKSEAQRFIDLFGLLDWQTDFEHQLLDDARANCRFWRQGKQAVLTLSTEWSKYDTLDDERVRRSAFHEVCELMLADIYGAATDVDMTGRLREERLERATHAVIRRLENVVLPRL
ncbi:MAG: hypothetical protein ACRDBZ_05235 [Citrobacter braakii]